MLKNPNYAFGPRDTKIPVSLNFGEFLLKQFSLFGDKVAIIDASTGEQTTYSQILQEAIDIGVSLTQLGIRKGETIALCSENRNEFFPSVIGCIFAGAVISPISAGYSKDEMKHILSICKPRYMICSPLAYELHSKTWKSLPYIKKFIFFGEKRTNGICYGDLINKNIRKEDFMPVDVKGQNDTAAILYSSGTTGLPKGVELTHYNAIATCTPRAEFAPMEVTRTLTISPWYHAMGFWGSFVSFNHGRTMVYLPRFTEVGYLEAIHQYKPHIITAPPPVLVLLSKSQLLSQYDVSSVQLMNSGAAPLDLETINDVKRRFPNLTNVRQGYGMTEMTLTVSHDGDMSPKGLRPKSVGVVDAGCVVKIVDIETGKVVGLNQRGEILVKGPSLMKGYVGMNSSEYLDSEGFYKTGDIGYFDEDKYLYIVDRLKELIKYKGYQVPPAELEAVLLQHKAVRDAAVVGKPDRSAGELPMAFVVKQPGTEVSEEEIAEFVASKVSSQKKLRGGVRFVNEIPKNPSGKILRKILRQAVKEGRGKL